MRGGVRGPGDFGPSGGTTTRDVAMPRGSDGGVTWTSYIAIGDSFSEGMCDPDPRRDNAFHGWTDRLAHMLAVDAAVHGQQFRYGNLAIRGRTLGPIIDEQLQVALDQQPDLISIVGGGNDLLRPHADPDRLADQMDAAVVRALDAGCDVFITTTTNPKGAGVLALGRGMDAIYTANLWSIAHRRGVPIVDLWGLTSIQDARMWADDRLHLTPEGHHRVAVAAAQTLGIPVDDAGTHRLEPADRRPWREVARDNGRWARVHLGPWVQRRLTGRSSGDLIEPKRPRLALLDPAEKLPEPRF